MQSPLATAALVVAAADDLVAVDVWFVDLLEVAAALADELAPVLRNPLMIVVEDG